MLCLELLFDHDKEPASKNIFAIERGKTRKTGTLKDEDRVVRFYLGRRSHAVKSGIIGHQDKDGPLERLCTHNLLQVTGRNTLIGRNLVEIEADNPVICLEIVDLRFGKANNSLTGNLWHNQFH